MTSRAIAVTMLVVVLVLSPAVVGPAVANTMKLSTEPVPGEQDAARDIQETIWFQGYLADSVSGDPIDATYTVVARMYDAASGGGSVWGPETHVGTSITHGWFNIELGSVVSPLPAFDSPPYFIQITVNGETLTPRLKLGSVPSAFQSASPGGLTLPYTGTYSGAGDAFVVYKYGADWDEAAEFSIMDAGSQGHTIVAANAGWGDVVQAYKSGDGGNAGDFAINNYDNSSAVVTAGTNGEGPAYYGDTDGLYAVEVYASYEGPGAHVVHAEYTGTGAHDAAAVYGRSQPALGWGTGGYFCGGDMGVRGEVISNGAGGQIGVSGFAGGGSGTNYGVFGYTEGGAVGWAGYFAGNVRVSGTLDNSLARSVIDHPLDPANEYLCHALVESPDMLSVHTGNVILDGEGQAWVDLPEWFEAVNRDLRYQLTPIGAPGPYLHVADRVSGNRFRIAGGEAGMEVSWEVTGVRQDNFAKANPVVVEEAKSERERGKYLHPEAYGLPRTMSVDYDEREEEQRRAHEGAVRSPKPASE